MYPGRPPLGVEAPNVYFAPPSDEGHLADPLNPGQLVIREVTSMPDLDVVSEAVEGFMGQLYGTERHASHNDRILSYYAHYSPRKAAGEEDQAMNEDANGDDQTAAVEVDEMAIILHDFVEHGILHPEKTAAKLGLDPGHAQEIRSSALTTFNEILDQVGDQDGLIKAYLFAIDASKWEAAARQSWRPAATARIDQMVAEGKMPAVTAKVVEAAINKTGLLDKLEPAEIERVLTMKDHCLIDLKLDAISQGTLNHNIQGLFLKGLETLDIIEHPPQNNPASTYRDCTEAINFFVPALDTLGYRQLAMDLRGAALQWLFKDPHGDAERQHALSEQYFERVRNIVVGLREQEFGGIEMDTQYRVKTEGSLRQKLASEDYEKLHEVPDGIGFAFIIPDEMAGEEMMQFASSYMERLTGNEARIVAKHPDPSQQTFEQQKKRSGYEAIHMTFYYYPEDGHGEGVPFEIQVITQTQYDMKLYGRSSDLFYKAGVDSTPEDQLYLSHLAKRAQAERELAPGSTVESIAELVALSPEIPSVFNKLFRAVDTPNGGRILVPAVLEPLASKISGQLAGVAGKPGELTVLPAAMVTEEQFKEALDMFERNLSKDKNIVNALTLVRNAEAGNKRRDGDTPIFEGHLLPTSLSALMMAIQSGKIWDSEKLGPREYMSNIVTITLLHDYVETELEKIEDPANIPKRRQDMLYEIKRMFGSFIMGGVDALTLPLEIEDQYARREQYRQNIQADGHARLIKPADRWQNHITDVILLATGKAEIGSDWHKRIMDYFAKTDRHQSADFTSPELSATYTKVHDIIWQFATHFGYDQEAASQH